MAITGTDRGTGTHNTSASSFTLSPSGNFAAGSFAVLVVSADNSASGGSSNNFTTVTDTNSNTWTLRQSPLFDNGAANAGVQGAIYTTPMDGGTLTTGSTITVNFGAATVAKAWTLSEVVPTSGSKIVYVTGGVNTGTTGTAPTVTTGSITNGNMVVGALFNEQGTGQTVTQDGDSTNGAWSAQQTAEIGTTAAGMSVSSQRKVVTSTAAQTFNPTLGVSSDVILAWVELSELVNVTGTLAATTAGLDAAATGTESIPSTAALTTAGLSVAATASHTEASPSFTASLTTAGLNAAATATEAIPSTASLTTAGLGATATAAESFTSTAGLTTAGLSAAATATEVLTATATLMTAGLSGAATVTELYPVGAELTTAGLSAAATATEAYPTNASMTIAGLGVAATTAEAIPASVALTIAGLTVAGDVEAESEGAVASLTTAGLSLGAAASEEMAAAVEVLLAGLSAAADVYVGVPVTGAAALTLAGLSCAVAATTEVPEPEPTRYRIPGGLWTPPYRPDNHPTRRRLK